VGIPAQPITATKIKEGASKAWRSLSLLMHKLWEKLKIGTIGQI
jgi:hypothetical protein